jgi:WXG100 family type VII secretion target
MHTYDAATGHGAHPRQDTGDDFSIDPTELDLIVDEMARCDHAIRLLTGDLSRQIGVLHSQWTGLAADAQRLAQAEWEKGLREMTASLAALRDAARVAHTNYTGAADTNHRMWQQLV